MDYKTQKFYYELDKCYFHTERDKEFASETERKLARNAMEYLWKKQSVKVHDITYSNEKIQQKIIDEMMPEILDRAVEVYREAKGVKSETAYLAGCIFRTLIDYNSYIERLVRQNCRR